MRTPRGANEGLPVQQPFPGPQDEDEPQSGRLRHIPQATSCFALDPDDEGLRHQVSGRQTGGSTGPTEAAPSATGSPMGIKGAAGSYGPGTRDRSKCARGEETFHAIGMLIHNPKLSGLLCVDAP